MKVATIVGTRPEIIRLSRVMTLLDRHTDHLIIHTGQNYDYELNQVFFEDLELRRPDHFLNAAGETAAETIGNVIARSGELLAMLRPDALLLLGDTNSCLSAIAAKRLKIPVFHMEAGNRCFDERVPEEINRRIVDHISDVNLPYSEISREYLLREGIPPDRVIKTGSPMREVLRHYRDKIESSRVLGELGLSPRQYFLLSAHREENVDDESRLRALIEVINAVAGRYGLPIVVSLHPRTRKRLESAQLTMPELARLHRPFGFTDYVHLMTWAKATLSDSGTITEESSILDLPALNLRETHERPEGMEEAAVMMTGLDTASVLRALDILEARPANGSRRLRLVDDYAADNVSEKVLRIILSYTEFVNRVVWRKP